MIKSIQSFFLALIGCVILPAFAMPTPLPPDRAFSLNVALPQKNKMALEWHIAPGYYLYKDRMIIQALPQSRTTLPAPLWPPGKIITVSGKPHEVYTKTLQVALPLPQAPKGLLALMIGYQGCSRQGFCYAPIKKILQVELSHLSPPQNLNIFLGGAPAKPATALPLDFTQKILGEHNLVLTILGFLGLGLLLAFTPCVLPMVPILSGIIIGHREHRTPFKTFSLSLSYVLGMALTYALAGLSIALLGSRVQVALQKPWVILLFSLVFVFLALALFGVYELRLPARFQKSLTALSNRQKGGTYVGVFLMGSISSLIVSPCVSAPLVGALSYIAQTGDSTLGFLALLALGLGMGGPLLLLGLSAGHLLPKAGHWMVALEHAMGGLMLAFAIWMAGRALPGTATLFLWGLLGIAAALYLGVWAKAIHFYKPARYGLALIAFVYGAILIMGAFFGNTDPWAPWATPMNKAPHIQFIEVKNEADLQTVFKIAAQQKKWALLDFYADWCVSCVKMERDVFTQPAVAQALGRFVRARVNMTENNAFDQRLLKQFDVIAPPTFLFFDENQHEAPAMRIVGEMNAKEFLEHLKQVKDP